MPDTRSRSASPPSGRGGYAAAIVPPETRAGAAGRHGRCTLRPEHGPAAAVVTHACLNGHEQTYVVCWMCVDRLLLAHPDGMRCRRCTFDLLSSTETWVEPLPGPSHPPVSRSPSGR